MNATACAVYEKYMQGARWELMFGGGRRDACWRCNLAVDVDVVESSELELVD